MDNLKVNMDSFPPWLTASLAAFRGAADRRRLGHALLIAGPRGVGKMMLARALAGQLIAPANTAPGAGDRHPDCHLVEPAEGKNTLGVDQIRTLCGSLALTSHSGGAKVALVAPAEAMTLSAANALLKTLEEPTPGTYLILVSHQPGRLPATIRSRCQTYPVARPTPADAIDWLNSQRHQDANEWAALLRFAGGGPLLALSLADTDFSSLDRELRSELKALSEGKTDPLKIAERWSAADPALCLEWLGQELKDRIRHVARGNEITDWLSATLHNMAWPERLRVLLARADRIDQARSLIGGGVNIQMTLRALLFEFAPEAAGKRK